MAALPGGVAHSSDYESQMPTDAHTDTHTDTNNLKKTGLEMVSPNRTYMGVISETLGPGVRECDNTETHPTCPVRCVSSFS